MSPTTAASAPPSTHTRAEFKKAESQRPPFDLREFRFEQTPNPNWVPGSGANNVVDNEHKTHQKEEIDPYGEGRPAADNYRLLISGIVPRPIGFVVSVGEDGKRNLAPFSYTTVVNHDPPVFCIGLSGSPTFKDTADNLLKTGECTINMISEWFVEAANFTSINAPRDVDEFELSGLTPGKSSKVNAPTVQESAFSIEAKVLHHHVWHSKTTGKESGTLFIVEGVNFHVREDLLNEKKNTIDIAKYRPVSRLGGIMYGRTTSAYELPRPDYEEEKHDGNIKI